MQSLHNLRLRKHQTAITNTLYLDSPCMLYNCLLNKAVFLLLSSEESYVTLGKIQ